MVQTCSIPVRFAGAVQLGFCAVASLNDPLDGRAGGQVAVHAYVKGWLNESRAVTSSAAVWAERTGFGVPAGPAEIVNVCRFGQTPEMHCSVSENVPISLLPRSAM